MRAVGIDAVAVLTLALGACALVSCGGDDDRATTTDVSTTAAPTTEPSPTTEPVETQPPVTDAPAATDPPTTDPPATDPPTTTGPDVVPYAQAAGLATVDLLPTEAGEQPVLAWTPVDGATSYRLAVLTSDGSPYWAWLGEATEVRFGGAPEPGGQTAIVFEPMTWRVIAVDADGVPIAASEPGELAP